MWLRCPEWNHKFAELNTDHSIDIAAFLTTPYIEFACSRCKRDMQDTDFTVIQVRHRFDLNGELVETSVERSDTEDRSIRHLNLRS